MRIVGIDCGTEKTGFGVIDTDGRTHQLVSAGVIRTRTADLLEERLLCIASELRSILETFAPEAFAVEEVFHAVNAKSALKLAHMRGVALLLAAEAGLKVSEYSPLEVKMSVVGYGRAEKQQVQMMVHSLLEMHGAKGRNPDLQSIESFDATDALAVAICHATHAKIANGAGAR
ncbi:MAG: crossover junction endodeoxyribonuclease RuvC [Acidobacteriaceae bacterium]|nr:crossover junction endodeoxyribonuclease RuvC [Acidobacteriaceae bacterium]MBV9781606.1 crossover junction endodeoxyribonuclease RuvC [Acidobacteriaceae bacterium]